MRLKDDAIAKISDCVKDSDLFSMSVVLNPWVATQIWVAGVSERVARRVLNVNLFSPAMLPLSIRESLPPVLTLNYISRHWFCM